MSESTDDLRARVAALEAENATLRAGEGGSDLADRTGHRPPRRSRAVLAVVMILLGVLLSPVAVVTGWAKWTLTDTERFVATYAPLSQDPAVKAYVVDQAMNAIEAQVDFDQVAQDLTDGLISLGTRPRATAALRTLQGSIAEGLRSQVRDGVIRLVDSDQFDVLWREALRVAHTQLIATLRNDPAAIARINADGSLGIPLDPIITQVKAQLVQRGVGVAQRIPTIDRTIVLLQSDDLPRAQLAYGAILAVGAWLPWVALALLVGGVLVANRRHRAQVWTGIGFALAMALLAIAFAAGRIALVTVVPASVLPGPVATLFYDAVTSSMQSTAVAATVLGFAVAIVGWLAGPFRTPTRLRGLYGDGVAALRGAAEQRGVTTGRTGIWVHRRRSLLLALIAVVAGIVLAANLPVSVSLVGWTAFWSVLAVVIVTLIERPAPEQPETELPEGELPAS